MVCMIGGAGSLPSKMARTKSIPAMPAMTSGGVTPYSTFAETALSSMGCSPLLLMTVIILNEAGVHDKPYLVMARLVQGMDCFVACAPRNDG